MQFKASNQTTFQYALGKADANAISKLFSTIPYVGDLIEYAEKAGINISPSTTSLTKYSSIWTMNVNYYIIFRDRSSINFESHTSFHSTPKTP